jgi:transposase
VDHVQSHWPKQCARCHADLSQGRLTGSVINHYVFELPPIRPVVWDHQCPYVGCPACGYATPGSLPPEVPKGNYGPSVQAMTGFVRGELRQSVRQTANVMTKLMHVPMSTGMVIKIQEQVSRALAAPYGEAWHYVQTADGLNADETSWRQDKRKAWLWVATALLVSVFIIRTSRGAKAAKDLLGESFPGILTTDRWASYNWFSAKRRQLCWSHLKRDFKSFLDYGPQALHLGERLLCETKKMFRLWHRVRDGTLTRAELQLAMGPVRRRIERLLEEGRGLPCAKVSGMCKEILKLREALFTFVDIEGIEPTNNAAERALRFAVLWRKGCFGCDSARGSRFVERFLTVRMTLRAQGRDLYTYLKDACTASLQGTSAPTLLPDSVVKPATSAIAA